LLKEDCDDVEFHPFNSPNYCLISIYLFFLSSSLVARAYFNVEKWDVGGSNSSPA